MFKRLVATSRAHQIMVLSMLRSFGKIGPQIDQIWAWLSRGHRWSPGVRNPLKSSVTGPSLLVNCYLEIKFHKIIRVNPPPPPPLKFRAPNLSNSLIKIGYQNSKYRDFFNEVSSDLPMMFLTHIMKFWVLYIRRKSEYTLITVSIFSKIIIELYEKVGKICLRRYRKISKKIINFCKIPFSCKNSDQSQLI